MQCPVQNPPTPRNAIAESKKRCREDDIPPSPAETDTLTKDYVMRNGAHHRLDYREMPYQAKQIYILDSRIVRLIFVVISVQPSHLTYETKWSHLR